MSLPRQKEPLGVRPKSRGKVGARYGCRETGTGHVAVSMEELDRLVQDVAIEKLTRTDAVELIVPRDSGLDVAQPEVLIGVGEGRSDCRLITECY